MKNSNYKKEIDDIHADKEWKQKIKLEMLDAKKPIESHVWKYALVTIACVVIVGIGLWIIQSKQTTPATPNPNIPNLAVLDIGENPLQSGNSMGYEAIMQQHVEDMKWENPWSFDNGITELPVFKNMNQSDGAGVDLKEQTEEELFEIGNTYVERFNFTIKSHHGDNATSYKKGVTSYVIDCKEASIMVEQKGSVAIWFSQDYLKEHPAILGSKNQTKAEALTSLKNVYNDFASAIGFEHPNYQIDLSYGYSMEEGEIPQWEYTVYEGSGSQSDQLIAKNFHHVSIYSDENNQLYGMRFNTINTSESIGNYPIVNLEEATARLRDGNFFASAPIGDFENIIHVEMVYVTIRTNENFMPYYKFYAPLKDTSLDNENKGSLKTYGAYYVSAIQNEYLKELPQDKRFLYY